MTASQGTAEAPSESDEVLRRLPPMTPESERGEPLESAHLGRAARLKGAAGARRRGSLLRRLLATADWLALVGALLAGTAASYGSETLLWALLFSPFWVLVVKLHGLYDHDHRRIRHSTLDEVPGLVSAAVLGMLTLDALLALSPAGSLDASTSILVAALAFAGGLSLRAALRLVWHNLIGMANGIVIGSPAAAEVIARRVAIHPETRLQLVGWLGAKPNGVPVPETNGADGADSPSLPRLGEVPEISEVARRHRIERVVVAEDEMSDAQAETMIRDCKAAGLALTFLPRHHTLLGPGVELNRLAELPVLDFRFADPPRSTMVLKRAMDIAIAGSLLLLLSPLFLGISLLILLDSGAPVLFRQTRVGKRGRSFTMLKFRTMVSDAETMLDELVDLRTLDEPAFKIPNDPRVTRVGRLLRRLSLDELPQLLNVLRGEMSLVGPRPEEAAVVALYDHRQRARLAVKPGLTGPMQIYGRGDLTFEERLALERDYLDNLSVTGDLAILMRTPFAVFRGDGAY
jgi:exopolysaccharide biosynthesis polyprenyl glycosylphosphotransferase